MKIVLASASPRRRELLDLTGLVFEVDPSDYSEDVTLDLKPHELVAHLSLEKARAVAARHPGALIVAADTLGVYRGRILGKPRTAAGATKMLETISGRMHRVITGFTVMDTAGDRTVTRIVETRVYFRKLAAEEIRDYVKSGEPQGKAGAYAIQGLGSTLIERIDGDFFNVVGLPLRAVLDTLKEFGVSAPVDARSSTDEA